MNIALKPGFLRLSIMNIAGTNFSEYKPTKKNKLKSIKKIFRYYEKNIGIRGLIKNNTVEFRTNNGYDYYNYFIEEWAKKYNLTISVHHYYLNRLDYRDVDDFYYLGHLAKNYAHKNFYSISLDNHIKYSLNKNDAVIIKNMLKKIERKTKKILASQCI